MQLVNLSRRLVIAGAVGFVFAPATGQDHGVSGLRDVGQKPADPNSRTTLASSSNLLKDTFLSKAPLKSLSAKQRTELGRTAIIGTVHCILASCMLATLPQLDLTAVAWDLYHLPTSPLYARLLVFEPCAVAYASLLGLRLLHVLTIQICMSVFVFHFLLGFFSPGDHSHKGFWSEYAACRLFCQLMLLAALNSWFSWPENFDELPLHLQYLALAFAAIHGVLCFSFCLRNLFLCVRNVDYTEDELVWAFNQWRWKEDLFQTLMDLQLAFVEGVQGELQEATRRGGSVSYFKHMFRQLVLLMRYHGDANDPSHVVREGGAKRSPSKVGGGMMTTPAGFKGKTISMLRELCDEKGVEHRHLKLKADIIEALSS
jgi:hypothetical protein